MKINMMTIILLCCCLTGCGKDFYDDKQRSLDKTILAEAEKHKADLEAQQKLAELENEQERKLQAKRYRFLTPLLKLATVFGTIGAAVCFIVRQIAIRDVRLHDISEQEKTRRQRTEAVLEHVFKNIDKLTDEERKRLFTNGGLLAPPFQPPLLGSA